MLAKQKGRGNPQKREKKRGEEEGMYQKTKKKKKKKGLALSLCWGQAGENKGGQVFSCYCTS